MSTDHERGLLIVIDGVDGAGKTTLRDALAEHLRKQNLSVHLTHEPSTHPVGSLIREYLDKKRAPAPEWQAMALLFAADRLQHLTLEIEPALVRGEVVLCDRYTPSNLAYQSAGEPYETLVHGRMKWISRCNGAARDADLTLILDVAPEVSDARRAARGLPETLFEKKAFLRQVRDGYRLAAERFCPSSTTHLIDASGTPEATLNAAWYHVEKLLEERGIIR